METLNDFQSVEFNYRLCSVMFGTDETILDIKLKNGFSFVRRSLNTSKDNLDSVFEIDAMGLRRAYEEARISQKNLDVICIEKCFLQSLI